MAASDNVVRAGLTPKYQDRETLLGMINYAETRPSLIEPRIHHNAPHTRHYEAPVSEFRLSISDHVSSAILCETGDTPEILFVTQGSLSIVTPNNAPLLIRSGEGVFVPACTPRYCIEPESCSFVRVTVPLGTGFQM
jgi:mannose-6-phosphate isomerase